MGRPRINGKSVLNILLDNSGLSWPALYANLGFESTVPGPEMMALVDCLMSLHEAGLITVDRIKEEEQSSYLYSFINFEGDEREAPKIRASQLWRKIRIALEMEHLPRSAPSSWALEVHPSFGTTTWSTVESVYLRHYAVRR
jgi:hypothetical protein